MPMRQPTPLRDQYRWYQAALRGDRPEIHDGEPQAGCFRMRMVKDGPFVPVLIWLEQQIDPETGELTGDEVLRCTVDGHHTDPVQVWTRCRPITVSMFDALEAGYAPIAAAPRRDPTKPVNLMRRPAGPHG